MDVVFKKFANEVNFTISKSFEDVSVKSASLDNKTGVFDLFFDSMSIIPFQEMQTFLKAVNTNFRYKAKISFDVTAVVFDPKVVMDYFSWIVGDFLKQHHLLTIIKSSEIKIDGPIMTVKVHSVNLETKLQKLKLDIERIMGKFGFSSFSFSSIFEEDQNMLQQDKEAFEERAAKISERSTAAPVEKKVGGYSKGYTKVEIDMLAESQIPKVAIEGEVFNVVNKPTKSELVITEIYVTNFRDAIVVKTFGRTPAEVAENSSFKNGDYVHIQGDYQFDAYSKEPTILVRKISLSKNPKSSREDNDSERRVELSVRTRMSTMDGIVSPKELVARAKAWKHKAVAIVDADGVQSFPDFYDALKGSGVKGIYGSTFNVVSKNLLAMQNSEYDTVLANDTFVVFDLETTGLSPIFDDIIEFGAVKVSNGQVVETKQFFISPTKEISSEIIELTGITNEMVAGAKPEQDAIVDIANFLGGSTLVAHNANFDFNFVNEKLEKYGYMPINNPLIDTMIVARVLQPTAKKFRLENVATRFGVVYDSTIAHRADYDADVLAKVWVKMISELASQNIINHFDLAHHFSQDALNKAFTNEVTLIARNQEGLKELFKYTSISSTDQYYKVASLFLEDLPNRQNVYLGSGALRSRLMDKLFFSSRAKVIEEIALYDYIEVQPPKNFSHLKAKGFTEQNIIDALKFLITEAKKQNKIVIATGDVRYLDEDHKLYHLVFINAKGLGGVRHHLYSYGNKVVEFPTLHFLTTDEMIKAFSFLEDINLIREIVITNSNYIADSIEEVQVIKDRLYTPKMGNSDEMLTNFVYETARAKYGDVLPERIQARIEKELAPIKQYGFAVIYWISHLLVSKSLEDGYLVGSRGSVGSSLVATLANITEVNPLEPHYVCDACKYVEFPEVHLNSGYDLFDKSCPSCGNNLDKQGQNIPFETFLGFKADKTPDIDLNFSGEYQPIIHNEVKRLFGDTHSFRAGTISTVAEKTAFGYVKSWAEDNKMTLSKAFTEFIAKGVTGTKRTSGQHPGGIIVIPKEMDVEDFTPINFPANDVLSSWKTTHFDFNAIHENVLKLDLLGHDDPTAIRMLEKLTGVNAKKDIPFYDPNVLSLFSSPAALGVKAEDINGEATGAMGIPEFGTKFVRRMLKKAKVNSFGDLISVSGLSHGTDVWANNAETLVTQHNKTLDEVISCRDNIMTDLMEKNIEPLTAFKIMESVRKGKGITEEQEALLKQFNVENWYIDSLKKIKYMFPKAHATAYVMMAWRVAWFKLYYPLAYYSTYFTTRADVFDLATVVKGKAATLEKLKELESRRGKYGDEGLTNKEEDLIPILELTLEAFARGVKVGNIDIKKSLASEWLIDNETKTIYPPFNSLDGLGEAVAVSIVQARDQSSFKSVEDLKTRSSINKTSLEKLRALGVLEELNDQNQMAFTF